MLSAQVTSKMQILFVFKTSIVEGTIEKSNWEIFISAKIYYFKVNQMEKKWQFSCNLSRLKKGILQRREVLEARARCNPQIKIFGKIAPRNSSIKISQVALLFIKYHSKKEIEVPIDLSKGQAYTHTSLKAHSKNRRIWTMTLSLIFITCTNKNTLCLKEWAKPSL